MKRDRRLRDLSDDHHQALVLARRATRAAAGQTSDSPRDVWTEVVHRFEEELNPHFQIEEQLLLPALEALGEHDIVARTREEHGRLRELVQDTDQSVEDRLAEFGKLLHDHVRFEERTLFQVAQDVLPEPSLDAVAAACAEARNKSG